MTVEYNEAVKKAVAEYLHQTRCNSSHNDQCSWGYEGDDWNGYAHGVWLQRAEKFIKEVEWRVRKYA